MSACQFNVNTQKLCKKAEKIARMETGVPAITQTTLPSCVLEEHLRVHHMSHSNRTVLKHDRLPAAVPLLPSTAHDHTTPMSARLKHDCQHTWPASL